MKCHTGRVYGREREREVEFATMEYDKSHHSISDFGRDRSTFPVSLQIPPQTNQTHPSSCRHLRSNPRPLPDPRHRPHSRNHHRILQNPSWTRSDHTRHRKSLRERVPKRLCSRVHVRWPLVLLTDFNPSQHEDHMIRTGSQANVD